jgi:hypothetical protein
VCSCLPDYIGIPPSCRPECSINSECPRNLACINGKCKDPCVGSCGYGSVCEVINHNPSCQCESGSTGDPFVRCTLITTTVRPIANDPCDPSPCGINAVCNNGYCSCLPQHVGDPYERCKPECVLNSDCSRNQACLRNKCVDPCPGTCGTNAICDVVNHIPVCSCPDQMIGNPFSHCVPKTEDPKVERDPCNPSPCGSNAECRTHGSTPVCSCLPKMLGSPPNCRPECIVSSECALNYACINQKCIDPCQGACGYGARCETINHSPICSCPPDYTGDPFRRCVEKEKPAIMDEKADPCLPSPCGPNSICRISNSQPICSCIESYTGHPPNCRPECTVNSECESNKVCSNLKCINPCPGVCGSNAECRINANKITCTCPENYVGDPFHQCFPRTREEDPIRPCSPSPCGFNAQCIEKNNIGSCICVPDYFGDPYEGCRPECVTSSDCGLNLACVSNKCKDPCPGVCGQNAECRVINHIPTCNCISSYEGDPFRICTPIRDEPVTEKSHDPCSLNVCGPNSRCKNINNQAVCSCDVDFFGAPPNCRPECSSNSECASTQACYKNKCRDPCPGTCGVNAECKVINHSPLCQCRVGYEGDPFTRCNLTPRQPDIPLRPLNPCSPSPCGPNSECRVHNDNPVCSCSPQMLGSPPNCRPECLVNSDCPFDKACLNQKCKDPCISACGSNSVCRVQNHLAICECPPGYTGNSFEGCFRVIEMPQDNTPRDPCNPSPCGKNAICENNGECRCSQEYRGDPYNECRPECVLSTECPPNKACIRNKCADPCVGICGVDSECSVFNHIPTCSCPQGKTGNNSSLLFHILQHVSLPFLSSS